MKYEFKSEVLKNQAEFVVLAAFEGDNECAIIDACSNDTAVYVLVIVNHGGDEECVLREEHWGTMQEALAAMHLFLVSEYAC